MLARSGWTVSWFFSLQKLRLFGLQSPTPFPPLSEQRDGYSLRSWSWSWTSWLTCLCSDCNYPYSHVSSNHSLPRDREAMLYNSYVAAHSHSQLHKMEKVDVKSFKGMWHGIFDSQYRARRSRSGKRKVSGYICFDDTMFLVSHAAPSEKSEGSGQHFTVSTRNLVLWSDYSVPVRTMINHGNKLYAYILSPTPLPTH